jgi:hypothetical protein
VDGLCASEDGVVEDCSERGVWDPSGVSVSKSFKSVLRPNAVAFSVENVGTKELERRWYSVLGMKGVRKYDFA